MGEPKTLRGIRRLPLRRTQDPAGYKLYGASPLAENPRPLGVYGASPLAENPRPYWV